MIAFIDEYRDRFSVEFICRMLNKEREGGFLSSRGYRGAKKRAPSARQVGDRELVELVGQIHAENYGVYGGAEDVACFNVKKLTLVVSKRGGS